MNIATPFTVHTNADAENAELPVHVYVHHNLDGLRHAARLLGGYDAMDLVDEIAEALRYDPKISRRTRTRLNTLGDLLRLENVGDPDRPEMGYFAVIDPNDPAVEEICLLTDGLEDAVKDWDEVRQRSATGDDRAAA